MSSKQFDLVVYGATGFTGNLVLRHLLTDSETNSGSVKWAMAARSQSKMDNVKQDLKVKLPSIDSKTIDNIPTIIADSSDKASLTSMVQQTKAVVSVVGPYTYYGTLLLEACVENGVNYCDLTGEMGWVTDMIQKYEAKAQSTGAVIVHCCGFESVPADMTTYVTADRVISTTKAPPKQVDLHYTKFQGGYSGGTIASIFAALESMDSKKQKNASNPFLLTDETTLAKRETDNVVGPNGQSVLMKYEKPLGKYSAFFIGGVVNEQVVHRSNYLMKDYYGSKFVYRERMAVGNAITQALMTFGVAIFGIMLYFRLTRALLKKVLPNPGEGPSEESMKNGYMECTAFGLGDDGQVKVKTVATGYGDPGYLMTSKVIAECGLCLGKEEFNGQKLQGGFYTPASAFGKSLTTRLHMKKIMQFDVQEA